MKSQSLFLVELLTISLFIFFVKSMQNEYSVQARPEAHAQELRGTVPQIRSLLNKLQDSSSVDSTDIKKLLKLFYENEKLNAQSYFPNSNLDSKLFFNSISKLTKKAKTDFIVYRFLLNLRKIIKRNAEFSEYLIKLVPKLALNNTRFFIKVYSYGTKREKKYLVDDLDYFTGPKEFQKFLTQLDSVTEPEFVPVCKEIKSAILQ